MQFMFMQSGNKNLTDAGKLNYFYQSAYLIAEHENFSSPNLPSSYPTKKTHLREADRS